VLKEKLKEEAPYFMRTLMDMTLPPPSGRLRIPIINTSHKQRAEQLSRSSLEEFCKEFLHEAPGHLIPYSEFFAKFEEWLPEEEKGTWSRQRIKRSLPIEFPSAIGADNKTFIVNASWVPVEPNPEVKKYIVVNGRIKKQK
jgi:hypothetical protein